MMKVANRSRLWIAALILYVGQAFLHVSYIYPKWEKDYSLKFTGIGAGLSPAQIALQLFGFREFLAGMLWVRADTFFDQGNYDAILPLVRLCTLLDPHDIDVYVTGMWHIAYNFTDQDQRSDRRYVPIAVALGEEGAKNNPNTYEVYFENGWLWYNKIDDDYDQAVKWFQIADSKQDILPARKNLLTFALLRDGQIEKALDTYYDLYDAAEQQEQKYPGLFQAHQNRDTIENNLDNLLVRMTQRGWFARKEGIYDKGDYDTKPPFDVGFAMRAVCVSDRVLEIDGSWNVLPVGTRIRVDLRDADYPGAKPAELNWDSSDTVSFNIPHDRTFMQDQLFVRDRRFHLKVDMTKDTTMYPFTAQNYVLEFYYDPRSAPAHIQDRFGYDGEGMTDAHYLRTDVRPGQRVMYCSFPITRDQILHLGEWHDKPYVIKTPGFKESTTGTEPDQQILVPTLRGSK